MTTKNTILESSNLLYQELITLLEGFDTATTTNNQVANLILIHLRQVYSKFGKTYKKIMEISQSTSNYDQNNLEKIIHILEELRPIFVVYFGMINQEIEETSTGPTGFFGKMKQKIGSWFGEEIEKSFPNLNERLSSNFKDAFLFEKLNEIVKIFMTHYNKTKNLLKTKTDKLNPKDVKRVDLNLKKGTNRILNKLDEIDSLLVPSKSYNPVYYK